MLSICRFSRRVLKLHCPQCPSVLLKYALPAFRSGGMYQLPHRSLATSGRPQLELTLWTKTESWWIERSRLVIDRVELLREDNILEKFCEAAGSTRDDVEVGNGVEPVEPVEAVMLT